MQFQQLVEVQPAGPFWMGGLDERRLRFLVDDWMGVFHQSDSLGKNMNIGAGGMNNRPIFFHYHFRI